jgi:hypothetical protein
MSSRSFLTCKISVEYEKMEQECLECPVQGKMVEDGMLTLESPLTPPNEDDALSPSPVVFKWPYHLYYSVDQSGIQVCDPNACVSVGKEVGEGPKVDENNGGSYEDAEIVEQMKDISLNK